MATPKLNLDGKRIEPLTICIIGGGGFIGSNLCEKLMKETFHRVKVVDVYTDRINHLLYGDHRPWKDRIEFNEINIQTDSKGLEPLITSSDLTINIAAVYKPADHNTRPVDTILRNFLNESPVIKYCTEGSTRLIHFSTCEVYGKTIASFLPEDHNLRKNPEFYLHREDVSPSILGSIQDPRWSFACVKQMMERLVLAESAQKGLNFTIVRPFNWIGPRMDFLRERRCDPIPGVLACFSDNLYPPYGPLRLVDGGHSRRTFCFIDDAIEAVLLMIENPERANGRIFNVGNPNNEVSIQELAATMMDLFSLSTNIRLGDMSTIHVSSDDFYGRSYDIVDRRIPDITNINRQLGWNPKTPIRQILYDTISFHVVKFVETPPIDVPSPPNDDFPDI